MIWYCSVVDFAADEDIVFVCCLPVRNLSGSGSHVCWPFVSVLVVAFGVGLEYGIRSNSILFRSAYHSGTELGLNYSL